MINTRLPWPDSSRDSLVVIDMPPPPASWLLFSSFGRDVFRGAISALDFTFTRDSAGDRGRRPCLAVFCEERKKNWLSNRRPIYAKSLAMTRRVVLG